MSARQTTDRHEAGSSVLRSNRGCRDALAHDEPHRMVKHRRSELTAVENELELDEFHVNELGVDEFVSQPHPNVLHLH